MENLITDHIDIWTSAQTQKTNGVGRGNHSANSNLYGIKKLRELILELAVRGKLVPQNPKDEPANILLEKIAKEKARLIKEGKLRRQEPLPEITEDEMPFELPDGWEWTRLGNLSANIHYGYTASADHGNSGIRLLRITDIQNDSVNWETVPGCELEEDKANDYLLENDDLLIARTGGTIGKSYLVENIDVKAVFASYLIRVKRIEGMYSPFIKTYLGSQLYWHQLYENSMGTGQPNVNATALKGLVFPLPPLAEQNRIVAKVDELMDICDQLEQQQTGSNAAHQTLMETLLATLNSVANQDEFVEQWQRIASNFDTLFTTEQSIEQLKQTILQLAVMGKLVPQNPNDEHASVLLKKIAVEKARLIKEGIIRNEKPLPEIDEDEKPFELPQGWAFTRLGNISNRIGSGSTPRGGKSTYEKIGIPFFRSQNIWNHGLELTDVACISEKTHQKMSNTVVIPNDILLNITGASLGRCTIFPDGLGEANVSQHVTIIRPTDSKTKQYLHLCILSPYTQSLVWVRQVGMAREGLSKKVLELFEIPFPPLTEQRRIVAKVNELMALCDTLKDRLNEAQTTQIQLADAIVEQAVA
jgi:type I restriction enzyme S subunit